MFLFGVLQNCCIFAIEIKKLTIEVIHTTLAETPT
jgi:hypothetical protein